MLFEGDATWCARCKSVVHRDCLGKAGGNCPSCRQAYDPAEAHFVFSRLCPDCFRPTNGREPKCRVCGARTHWDNQQEYDDFLEQMKDTSRVCALRKEAKVERCRLQVAGCRQSSTNGQLRFLNESCARARWRAGCASNMLQGSWFVLADEPGKPRVAWCCCAGSSITRSE